ncbi:MAG: HNH endonuclease [Pseudomonadota bacterium]
MSDQRILQAAFAEVGRLQVLYDDAIPWAEIEKGFAFNGAKHHLASKAIGIFKPAGMKRGVLSIKTVVPKTGRVNIYNDRQASDELYRYSLQAGDSRGGNNRYLWQAKELGQPFIYFHGVYPGFYAAIWPCYVGEIYELGKKNSYCDIYVGLQGGESLLPSLVNGQYHIPDSFERRYAVRESKVRLHQSSFRQAVLEAYDNKCAMTGLPSPQLLDAAHIIPDASVHSEASVRNGIALSKLHHSAFDKNMIGIDPDFRIHVSDRVMRSVDGPLLEQGIKGLNGKVITVPKNNHIQPSRDFLAERFDRFRLENS